MGFFDRLKESASKAADKAKDSVEVVRLNSQISTKRGEIEKLYIQIGKTVFQAHAAGDLTSARESVQSSSDSIIAIQQEITQLEKKVKAIKEVKDCVCGQELPLEAKFCSTCGHKFEDHLIEPEAGMIETALSAPTETDDHRSTENEEEPAATKVCPSCETPVGHSDRFCENCGSQVN